MEVHSVFLGEDERERKVSKSPLCQDKDCLFVRTHHTLQLDGLHPLLVPWPCPLGLSEPCASTTHCSAHLLGPGQCYRLQEAFQSLWNNSDCRPPWLSAFPQQVQG